jgi:hypothetical protein
VDNAKYPELMAGMRFRSHAGSKYPTMIVNCEGTLRLLDLQNATVQVYRLDLLKGLDKEYSTDGGETWQKYAPIAPAVPAWQPFTSADEVPPLNQIEFRDKDNLSRRGVPHLMSETGDKLYAFHFNMLGMPVYGAHTFKVLFDRFEMRVNGGAWTPAGILK